MAINKAVAGQSIFQSININVDGTLTVYGSGGFKERLNYHELDADRIASIEEALAIGAGLAGFESGDEEAIKTELVTDREAIFATKETDIIEVVEK